MPPTRRRGAETGQATIEHVGVMLLVAAVLGAAVLVADAAGAKSGIAGSVRRQMARAICLVGQGTNCNADLAACLKSSDGHTYKGSFAAGLLHVGGDRGVMVQRLSDDSFQIDEVAGLDFGGQVSTGTSFKGQFGQHKFKAGTTATAALLAHLRAKRSWTLRSPSDANTVIGALTHIPPQTPSLPPTSAGGEAGLSASADVTVATRNGAAAVSGVASAKALLGITRDTKTRNRTIYLHPSGDAQAQVALSDVTGSFSGALDEVYAVTVDQDGTPLDFSVVASGTVQAQAVISPELQKLSPASAIGSAAKRSFSVERHLDLSSDEAQTAVARFIAHLTHPDPDHIAAMVDNVKGLKRLLDESGTGVAQVHSVKEGGAEVGGQIAFGRGVALGASAGRVTESSHLIGASAR